MKKKIVRVFEASGDPDKDSQIIQEIVEYIKMRQEELNPRRPLEETEWIYCLVGNMVSAHYFGTDKEIKRGNNLFAANAKLYVFPRIGDYKHQNIRVVGHALKGRRLIMARTRVKWITNWRLQKVYSKRVIEFMFHNNGWRDTEVDKETILKMLEWLPNLTETDLPNVQSDETPES